MSRMIAFADIINARDLGGLTTREGNTIRKGSLLRTANLSQATEADLATLRQDLANGNSQSKILTNQLDCVKIIYVPGGVSKWS